MRLGITQTSCNSHVFCFHFVDLLYSSTTSSGNSQKQINYSIVRFRLYAGQSETIF